MRETDFRKTYFSGWKCRKYAEKPFFGIFSRFHQLFFLIFAQRRVLAMLKIWPSPIFEKHFFPAENAGNMLKIAVSADFLWTFSTYFVVLFHTKTFVISLFRSFFRSLSFVRSFVRSLVHTLVRTFIIR